MIRRFRSRGIPVIVGARNFPTPLRIAPKNTIAAKRSPQSKAASQRSLSNHYHFIAKSPQEGKGSLAKWIGALHRKTAIHLNVFDDY